MRSGSIAARGIVTSVLATFMCAPAAPQTLSSQHMRQLSPEQGEAVVRAAWELRKGLGDPKPDCSHFVNAIYEKAGLVYEYAPTADLFAGIDAFQRVQRPQAGDLVVWQGHGRWAGHVGIVIDPGEHTFYSSVNSGFAIEDYRSEYWTGRGHPRFYRYLIDEAQSARLRAHTELARNASATRPPARSGYQSLSKRTAQSSDPPDQTASREPAATDRPESDASDAAFVSSRSHPLNEEIHAALLRSATANAEIELQDALLDTHRVAIADEFTVTEVKIQGKSGWAEFEIHPTMSIQNGKAELKAASEKWRVNLRREAKGWMMLMPRDKTCLPRDVAVKTLAARIARISRNTDSDEELRIAVKVLDELVASDYMRVSEKK